MEKLQPILERRSIRQYTKQRVPRETLEMLARAGMAAPTSRDTRHLRFIIVDDPALIDRLTEGLPYAKMLSTARHAIIVASDLSVAYGGFDIDYWLQDSSAAAENILIAAKTLGLGSCWTGVHPREERVDFITEVLALPANVRPLCVIAIGVPAVKETPRDKFDPKCVHWNQWGRNEA